MWGQRILLALQWTGVCTELMYSYSWVLHKKSCYSGCFPRCSILVFGFKSGFSALERLNGTNNPPFAGILTVPKKGPNYACFNRMKTLTNHEQSSPNRATAAMTTISNFLGPHLGQSPEKGSGKISSCFLLFMLHYGWIADRLVWRSVWCLEFFVVWTSGMYPWFLSQEDTLEPKTGSPP